MRDENAVASKITGDNFGFNDPPTEALASQMRAITHALLWIEISKQHDRLIDLEREMVWWETVWNYRFSELGCVQCCCMALFVIHGIAGVILDGDSGKGIGRHRVEHATSALCGARTARFAMYDKRQRSVVLADVQPKSRMAGRQAGGGRRGRHWLDIRE